MTAIRRGLAAILVVTSLLASLPTANAQVATPPLEITTTPASAEIFAGDQASFTVKIGNSAIFERSAKMRVTSLPPDWTYSFTPDPVLVPANGNATTTLAVFVPATAQAQTLKIVFEAVDETIGGFTRASVNITVRTRSGAEAPAALGPPRIHLSAAGGEPTASGETAQGIITLTHDDPQRASLAIQLSVSAPAGWNAYLKAADQNRNLAYGQTATLPVQVEIPALSEETRINVTITALVDGSTFTTRWAVTGTPAAAAESAPTTSETPSPETTAGGAPPKARSEGPNFEVRVEPVEVFIESGASQTLLIKLANTGTTTLDVRLAATQPSVWRPIDLASDIVTIGAGDTIDIPMTLHTPEGIPAGGTADVLVTAMSDGIIRNANVVVRTIVPTTAREDTSAATIEAPVAPEGSGLPTLGTSGLIAVGLVAVGSGTLLFASRSVRTRFLWGAAGLYTRLARPDVLGHEDREKLYRLIESQPGIHFHALQRELAWNTGTLTYHVRVLERHGFAVSRRDGLYRRFYLSGAAPRKEVFENQGPTGLRADVLEAVRSQPGISQSDLALGLGANKQTVNYHVKALERVGTIRVEKRGRDTFLYLDETPVAEGPGTARA